MGDHVTPDPPRLELHKTGFNLAGREKTQILCGFSRLEKPALLAPLLLFVLHALTYLSDDVTSAFWEM